MEKLQLHLASKIEHPAVLNADKSVKTPARTETLHGMSNRGVRIRILDPDQVEAIQLNAAKIAGPDATNREIYSLAVKHCCYAMVYEVSDPTDNPTDPKLKWKPVDSTGFMSSSPSWRSLFTTKDTQILEAEYRKWHQMDPVQAEMLSGKAIPIASEA